MQDLDGEDLVQFLFNRGVLVGIVALVKDNLGVFTRVDNDAKHFTVHHEGTAGDKVAQAQVVVFRLLSGAVGDDKLTVEVVKVGVGQLAGNLNFHFPGEVLLDLLLGLLDWQFRFQVPLAVKLSGLDKTFISAGLVSDLEYDAISWDLLLVLEDENVTDFNVSETCLANVVFSFGEGADFLDGGAVDFLIGLVTREITDAFLKHTNEDNDTEDDGDDEGGVNPDLGEGVQDHHTEPCNVGNLCELNHNRERQKRYNCVTGGPDLVRIEGRSWHAHLRVRDDKSNLLLMLVRLLWCW